MIKEEKKLNCKQLLSVGISKRCCDKIFEGKILEVLTSKDLSTKGATSNGVISKAKGLNLIIMYLVGLTSEGLTLILLPFNKL